MASTSLLAHLYSRIKGSQEDVATLSLQYIISQSPELNREFTRLLSQALHVDLGTALNYVCQSVGDNLERPDIAGVDQNGQEIVLCEAKFYAGLTENQPNGYLNRLAQNGGAGLVFICPAARKETLWSKLLDLCGERSIEPIDKHSIFVDRIAMSIVTWGEIIEALRHVASTEATATLPDIYQLEGFCKLIDAEAFIPFSPEDFGPENAIKEERNYQVLDALFNRLMADSSFSSNASGLRATPQRNGYARYLQVNDYCVSLNYDRRVWRNPSSEETPFWITIRDSGWKQSKACQKAFNKYSQFQRDSLDDCVALALRAPINASLEEVTEELANQVKQYILDLDKALAKLKA